MNTVSDEQILKVKESLLNGLEKDESTYTKPKHVECDIDNRLIGNAMSVLSDKDDEDIKVEHYSGEVKKVWKVTRLR